MAYKYNRRSKLTKKDKKAIETTIGWLFKLPFYLIGLLAKLIAGGINMLRHWISPKKQVAMNQEINKDACSFEAVGVNYRLDDLLTLAEPSRTYTWDDDKLLQKYGDDQTIYKYFFNNLYGSLVPEPSNPHDPNAIKVELNNVHVAYVPADLCDNVKELLLQGYTPRVSVRGGPCKQIKNGVVTDVDKKFRIYVDMTIKA